MRELIRNCIGGLVGINKIVLLSLNVKGKKNSKDHQKNTPGPHHHPNVRERCLFPYLFIEQVYCTIKKTGPNASGLSKVVLKGLVKLLGDKT